MKFKTCFFVLFIVQGIFAQTQNWQNNTLNAYIIGGIVTPASTPITSIESNAFAPNGDVIRLNPWATIDGNYISNGTTTLSPTTSILNMVRNIATVRSIDVNGIDKWLNLIEPFPYTETDNWNITNYFINQHIGVNDVTTDASGNVYVVGTFLQVQEILEDHLNYPPGATPPLPPSCMGGVDFGYGNTLTATYDCSDKNGFLVKYDANGNYIWSKLLDYDMTAVNFGANMFEPKKLVIDPISNDIIVVCELNGSLLVDGQITTNNSPQIVATRLTGNGSFLNHYNLGLNNQPNTFQTLAIDGFGKFIIGYNLVHNAGYSCCNTLTLGGTIYDANNQTAGYSDYVLAKFSPLTNSFDWQQRNNTTCSDRLIGLSIDVSNNIYTIVDKTSNEPLLFGGQNTQAFTGQLLQKYTDLGIPVWMHCTSTNNLNIFDNHLANTSSVPNRIYSRSKVLNTNGNTLYTLAYTSTENIGAVNGQAYLFTGLLTSNHATGIVNDQVKQYKDYKLFSAPDSGIHTGFCDTTEHYCAGDTILIPYTTNDNTFFQSGNIFTAQLSDASGSFGSPITLGSGSSSTSGIITGIIPQNVSAGNGYQIRVVASLPSYIGASRPTTIRISALPQFTIQVPTHTCVGNGVTLKTSAPFSNYLWTLPVSTASSDSIYTTITGNYTVQVTDGNGCKASQSVSLVNQAIAEICGNGIDDDCDGLIDSADPDCCPTQITIHGDSTLCYEQQLLLTADVNSPSAEISWMSPDSAILADSVLRSYFPGIYTVTAIVNGTCTLSRQVNVVQAPDITWSLTGDKLCYNTAIGSLDLSVNGAAPFSYNWTNNITGANDQLEDHNGIPTTFSYSGYITDSFGCSTPAYLGFVIGQPIQINVTGETLVCGSTSGSVNIEGTGGFSFFNAQGDPYYTGDGSFIKSLGTYNVTLTDAIGCTATTNYTVAAPCACNFPNLTITVKNATSSNTAAVIYCHNSTISLALTAVRNASYRWVGSNGSIYFGRVLTIPNATASNSGTYKVYISRGGCLDSLYASVIVQPQIIVTPMPTTLSCPNSTITLTASANTAPVTYQWTRNSLPVSPTFVVNATTTGTYAVRVTDNYQCSAAATTKVGMYQPNAITPSFSLQNNNTRFRLNVNGSTLMATNASYLWTGPNNFTSNLKQPLAIAFIPANYGTYTVQVVTMNGCTLTSSVNVRPVMKMNEEDITNTESLSLNNITLYPNPANDFIQIETDNRIENIVITTLLGEQVINEYTSSAMINIKTLPAGVYVMTIKTNQQNIIRRFVKE